MGIVNVTPDSFSDGGRYYDPAAAVAHGLELVAQGAEILDIGGESTRPGAAPVAEAEELRRVLPVVEGLAAHAGVALSIDTQKPAVARAALLAGASMVNDVGAAHGDPAMWRVVAEFQAGYVVMHAPGRPTLHPAAPVYANVVREVQEFFGAQLDRLQKVGGIAPEQVVLDPGIGFGKTLAHNLQLLGGLQSFTRWHRPLLLGVSRKSFIERSTGARIQDRLPASLACASWGVAAGVNLLRAHDVAETVQAVRMAEAIRQNAILD